MGNVLSSPMKLKPGMKVLVCWHRDWIPFTWYQVSKGYKHGKWFKGELLSIVKYKGQESYVVRINCDNHWLHSGDVIVIRSTSREDNLTPSELRTNERQRKAYRAKKLAATEAKKRIKATGEAGALLADKNTEASKFPFTLQHIADILGD